MIMGTHMEVGYLKVFMGVLIRIGYLKSDYESPNEDWLSRK